MDVHIPAAITRGLRMRGVDVLTALQDQMAEAPDIVLLERATELGRLLFPQDEDFLALGREWQNSGKRFSGIIYVHQDRLTIGQCLLQLETISKAGEKSDYENRVQFLPIRSTPASR